MKKYFPILLSKAGELTALKNLRQPVKDEIAPIIQVLPDNYDRVEKALLADWNFNGNLVYLDFSLCTVFDRRTRLLIVRLLTGRVNVIPVAQINSNIQYIRILQGLILNGEASDFCLRFSNGSGGFINLNTQISTLLTQLGIARTQSSILLDLGFVESHNYNMISALAIATITGISNKNDFNHIIVGSSSFLENLSSLTPAGRLYRLQRYEWDIWLAIQAQSEIARFISYADYGTKYPFYAESNFQGSCSIKYTLVTEFIIYRGEISGNHSHGNGQYISFANRLVSTTDYSGSTFSWGDAQIDFYANQILTDPKRKTGNATSWVEISQNHHITLLHSLL